MAQVNVDQLVFKEIAFLGGLGQSWDTEAAVGIINSQRYPIQAFISDVFPVSQADAALKLARNNDPEVVHLALRPE